MEQIAPVTELARPGNQFPEGTLKPLVAAPTQDHERAAQSQDSRAKNPIPHAISGGFSINPHENRQTNTEEKDSKTRLPLRLLFESILYQESRGANGNLIKRRERSDLDHAKPAYVFEIDPRAKQGPGNDDEQEKKKGPAAGFQEPEDQGITKVKLFLDGQGPHDAPMAGQLHGFSLEDDKPVEREGEKGKPKTPGKIRIFLPEAKIHRRAALGLDGHDAQTQQDHQEQKGKNPGRPLNVKLPQIRTAIILKPAHQHLGDQVSRNHEKTRYPVRAVLEEGLDDPSER